MPSLVTTRATSHTSCPHFSDVIFTGKRKKGVTPLWSSNSMFPIDTFYTPVAHFSIALPPGVPSKGRIVASLSRHLHGLFSPEFQSKEEISYHLSSGGHWFPGLRIHTGCRHSSTSWFQLDRIIGKSGPAGRDPQVRICAVDGPQRNAHNPQNQRTFSTSQPVLCF